MYRFNPLVAVSCVLALVLLGSEALAPTPTGPPGAMKANPSGLSKMSYDPGDVIVKFKSGVLPTRVRRGILGESARQEVKDV